MPRSKGAGLVGEPAKEVWIPDALKLEHDRQEAEYQKSLSPKMRRQGAAMSAMPMRLPWTSIGVAPTAEQVHDSNYGGSA